ERGELDAIRAERVRLENIGAGPDVRTVDLAHDLGVRKVERVERPVHEHATRVQHRAHCAVAHEHAVIERVEEPGHAASGWSIFCHSQVAGSTRRYERDTRSTQID